MATRFLGRTGLLVSALGFGCGSQGGLFVRGEAAEQVRAAGRAIEAGVSYFDTAPSYGDGRSEENLGRTLRELSTAVHVGTKVRLAPGDLEDATPAIRRSLEASLSRLQREFVDLLQLHTRVTLERGTRGGSLTPEDVLGPVLGAMRAVKAAGLAHFIGLTALGDTEALSLVLAAGAFDTAQVYFNALNPSAGYAGSVPGAQDYGGLIDAAAEQRMGVLAIRVLAAGAMAGSGERHPVAGASDAALSPGSDYDADIARAQRLAGLAGELGLEGPLELALRFALSKPGISTVLAGFSDLAQLEAAVRWAERGALPADAVARVCALARDASR
ncbi:MAG: aldo/keto reductase [Chloroflexi bacterium]|nr:aldo/keto reductase [Chloroflexota bacterium]